MSPKGAGRRLTTGARARTRDTERVRSTTHERNRHPVSPLVVVVVVVLVHVVVHVHDYEDKDEDGSEDGGEREARGSAKNL